MSERNNTDIVDGTRFLMYLLEMNGRETPMVEREVGVPPGRITYQSKAYELGKRFGPCPGRIRKVLGTFGVLLSRCAIIGHVVSQMARAIIGIKLVLNVAANNPRS